MEDDMNYLVPTVTSNDRFKKQFRIHLWHRDTEHFKVDKGYPKEGCLKDTVYLTNTISAVFYDSWEETEKHVDDILKIANEKLHKNKGHITKYTVPVVPPVEDEQFMLATTSENIDGKYQGFSCIITVHNAQHIKNLNDLIKKD